MELRVDGTPGQTVTLFGPELSRVSLLDPAGRAVTAVDRADSHFSGTTTREWTFGRNGAFTLQITGDSPILLMLTRPEEHIP